MVTSKRTVRIESEMPAFFFDTSCLFKELLPESGTEVLGSFVERAGTAALAGSVLLQIEAASAIRRSRMEGRFSVDDERLLQSRWERFSAKIFLVPINADVIRVGVALLNDPRIPGALRSLDALQMATFTLLREQHSDIVLLTADRRMREAVKALGYSYFDPME